MSKDLVTIIIPAKNEESSIVKTLEILKKELKIPYQILVINDHSTDNTVKVVKEYLKKDRKVSLINNPKSRRGFSSALKTGFEKTKSKYVLPVMADLCDDPKTINKMYQKINQGWDIICGSRYIKGGKKIGGPKLQGFLSKLVCISLNKLTGVPTKDISNAFKIYRKDILKDLYISEKSGVEASMEITMQSFYNGAKITDIPTTWTGRKMGKSKFKLLERAPLYLRIYSWSINNKLRKIFHLPLLPYNAR